MYHEGSNRNTSKMKALSVLSLSDTCVETVRKPSSIKLGYDLYGCIFQINYVNMKDDYVYMQDDYVKMQVTNIYI